MSSAEETVVSSVKHSGLLQWNILDFFSETFCIFSAEKNIGGRVSEKSCICLQNVAQTRVIFFSWRNLTPRKIWYQFADCRLNCPNFFSWSILSPFFHFSLFFSWRNNRVVFVIFHENVISSAEEKPQQYVFTYWKTSFLQLKNLYPRYRFSRNGATFLQLKHALFSENLHFLCLFSSAEETAFFKFSI